MMREYQENNVFSLTPHIRLYKRKKVTLSCRIFIYVIPLYMNHINPQLETLFIDIFISHNSHCF